MPKAVDNLQAKSLSPSLNDDVLGLILFKADIQDPEGKLSSWNEDDDSPCNNWIGVQCNPRSNRVFDLVLDGFVAISTEALTCEKKFTGNLTLSFSQLSNLRVHDLSENGFLGSISSDLFSQCRSLRSISLAKNKFSGPVPES
ncbi:hypothetical protein ACS0TY_022602 [Phlomoides rotata]